MSLSSAVQPRLTVLSSNQIEQVHAYSLKILATVGIRVDSEKARRVFAQADGAQVRDDDRVFVQPELVEWAIKTAPSSVDIYNRKGEFVFRLGDDRIRFGIGVTNLYYQDPQTDQVSPFTRKHMETSVRLGDALSNFDVISTIGILQDIPPETADLYATLEMVANTIKPLVILVSDENLFSPTLDLLETLHGDLNANPFIVPYVNPITPLILNKGAADKMREAIGRGLPVIYSNYSMAGMSTPITSAGTLSLLNAELLVGLVFSQLVKSGAPIILGSLPAFFDMKTMLDYYEPQTFLINLACAEMMAHYRIPHCGTSGSGRGWGPDLSASSDLWMNHLTSCIGKVGLAPFVGGSLGSKVFSATSVVVADEIITEALRFAQGFALDDETAALNEIDVTGPGGSFLTSELTLKLFRKAHYTSKIYPRISLEKWEASGRPQAIDLLRDHTQQLLAKLNPLDDSADLVGRGEVFIRKFAVRPQE